MSFSPGATHQYIAALLSGSADVVNLLFCYDNTLKGLVIDDETSIKIALKMHSSLIPLIGFLTIEDKEKQSVKLKYKEKKRLKVALNEEYPVVSIEETLNRTQLPRSIWTPHE